MDFLDAIIHRRSVYKLSAETTVSDDRVVEIVKTAIDHMPSPWNGQEQRAMVLLGEKHVQLWDIVEEVLVARVAPERVGTTQRKIAGFRAGRGTVMFFDDRDVVANLQEKFPKYHDTFEIWAEQCMGMAEYGVWIALEAEGLGCNLQHYNPIIDDEVRAAFDVPESWRLGAELVFGHPVTWPGPREHMPIDERVRVEGLEG